MANTYSALHYHVVFSTKGRIGWFNPEIEQRVWEYIGGIARHNNFTALQVGGFDDHINALVMASPAIAPSKIAQLLKGDSSLWLHTEFPELKQFAWQDGYGVFTVSKSNLESVIRYIQNQRAHHQQKSFEDEYREFLQIHGVDYDEKSLLG